MSYFDAIAQGMNQAVPFAGFLGVEVTHLAAAEATVVLVERPELTNHVGSRHAGALFTVAEAASGAAFVGAFAERMADVTPLARSAEISYEKLTRCRWPTSSHRHGPVARAAEQAQRAPSRLTTAPNP
jgi:hypothetical protein